MILTYHELSAVPCGYEYSVTQELFRQHVELVRSACEALPKTAGRSPVTFDDGHLSQYRLAAPLLEEQGCREATFFVTAAWTGRRSGYMSALDLKDLVSRGFAIQSHGWSHKLLTQCSDSELNRELRDSKRKLEDCTGMGVDAISIPGGAWDERVLAACAAAGYRSVYISDPWFGQRERERVTVFGRLMVRRGMTVQAIEKLLAAENRPFSLRRLPWRVRQGLRKLLGPGAYQVLWNYAANISSREEIHREYRPGKCS